MAKPITEEQKRRATERVLLKKYGTTIAERDARLAEQNHGCAICGKEKVNRQLNIDHCHRFAKQYRIRVEKHHSSGTWYIARSEHKNDPHLRFYAEFMAGTRKDAIDRVKQAIRRASVRGLLCWRCNSGLRYFNDDPVLLSLAAEYLRDFERNKE